MRLFPHFSLIYVIKICKTKTIFNQYNNRTKRSQEIEKINGKLVKKVAKPNTYWVMQQNRI